VPPTPGCPGTGPPSPEVTGASCRVPSTPFSQAPGYAQPVHLCRFRVRSLMLGLFPGPPWLPDQSTQVRQRLGAVTTSGPRTINLVAIGYGCRPRLRGRLTLRGLAWRRNPWTSGDRVSHSVGRYSCQHAHFRYLQRPSRTAFTGLRNAPLPVQRTDDRRQMTEVPSASRGASPAASWQSRDTPVATPAMSPRRCSRDRDNSGTTAASRPPIPWRSSRSA
jgi:hypothetical protein